MDLFTDICVFGVSIYRYISGHRCPFLPGSPEVVSPAMPLENSNFVLKITMNHSVNTKDLQLLLIPIRTVHSG
jgi:hypothetical protein